MKVRQLHRILWPVVLGFVSMPLISAAGAPAASAAPPTPVQAAWSSSQGAIATATATATAQPLAAGAQNQAYAAAYVRELAQFDLDNQLITLNPDQPILFREPDPLSVPGLNPSNPSGIWNPDNVNYIAVISGAGTYQLRGLRGNSVDLNFQAENGFPGNDSTAPATATLGLSQLTVNPDGTYTVNIGQTPEPGNYLPTTPETTLLSIRETFNDWATAVPDQLTLVRTDQSGPPLVNLSTTRLVSAINAASAEVIEEGGYWESYWAALLTRLPPNVVLPAAPTVGGLPTQVSSLDQFDLAPGQALVIKVAPDADAGYQGLEVADVWGQTLPYATHDSSLNGTQAYLGSDGFYHFVISPTDPGVPNWINTDDHDQGFVFLRWQRLIPGSFTSADSPTGELVSLSDLASVLPSGTPKVTPQQRAVSLFLRDLSVARRIVLSSNPAGPVLAKYLTQLTFQIGPAALHTVYPPNVP